MTVTTLTAGKKYNIEAIKDGLIGFGTASNWSDQESSLSLYDYFDSDGRYLGADVDGVEPVFDADSV